MSTRNLLHAGFYTGLYPLAWRAKGHAQLFKEQMCGISTRRQSAKNKKPGALFSAPGLGVLLGVSEV